jgi:hypothetical protein
MTMPTWLPLLIVLACPVMMIFMMRGMSGHGHSPGPTQAPHSEANTTPNDPRDERLAELEREVAQLRTSRDRTDNQR